MTPSIIILILIPKQYHDNDVIYFVFEFLPGSQLLLTVVCFDAKINFDDSAKFRQADIFRQEDTSESDPREVEAAKHDLNYIGMTGNIGCLGEYHMQRILS